MAQAETLDADTLVFLKRALPHVMAGKSIADAMRAVLDDDARLMNAAFARGGSDYFPTADERGISRIRPDRTGDVIFSHISAQVHAAAQVPA